MAGSEPLELITEIKRICVNEAGVSAYYYRQCTGFSAMTAFMRISNLEEFCTCYGNAMAKNYAKQPSLYRQHIQNLRKAAFRSCKGK